MVYYHVTIYVTSNSEARKVARGLPGEVQMGDSSQRAPIMSRQASVINKADSRIKLLQASLPQSSFAYR